MNTHCLISIPTVSFQYPLSHPVTLTLSPMAERRRPYTGIGLKRSRAMVIVGGMYARRRVLSLVPAYEVCVCKWRGAPCTHSTFIEMAPGLWHTVGPMEIPPLHTQADGGVGGQLMRRELGRRDHVLGSRDHLTGHVTIIERRGGGTQRVIGYATQDSSAERCTRSV